MGIDINQIRKNRMDFWVDQVLKNLEEIEESVDDIGPKDYLKAIEEVKEQYRLLSLMKKVLDGKTKLDGFIKNRG